MSDERALCEWCGGGTDDDSFRYEIRGPVLARRLLPSRQVVDGRSRIRAIRRVCPSCIRPRKTL